MRTEEKHSITGKGIQTKVYSRKGRLVLLWAERPWNWCSGTGVSFFSQRKQARVKHV